MCEQVQRSARATGAMRVPLAPYKQSKMKSEQFRQRRFRKIRRDAQTEKLETLLSDVRHQCHKAGALDSLADGVLACCGTTGLPSAHDSAMTIHKLGEKLDVLVVHVHRSRPLAFDQ